MANQLQEFNEILQEAYKSIDQQLAGDDKGWIQLGTSSHGLFPADQKISVIERSRYYSQIDPMAAQALRLHTDYTFGTGLTWQTKDEATKRVMDAFWYSHDNAACLSCAGQRKSSHNLLRDGAVYFAIFLGQGEDAKLRRIDPLEITETITDPDDADTVWYFKRTWIDAQSRSHEDYYRSWQNIKETGEAVKDSAGMIVKRTQDAVIYRLERDPNGLPLLLPALDWIKLYRQFLASRAAIMLALSIFAWKSKVKGGAAAIATAKAKVQDIEKPGAGSHLFENEGIDTQPIKTDTGAGNAKTDGDMLKLMICAATGLAIQYFGDVSTGNLATAKTCELPMIKMFESYQSVWEDTYNDICDIVLNEAGVSEEKRHIDWQFPSITPEDAAGIATNIAMLIPVLPELAYCDEITQAALMACGVKDINDAIEQLTDMIGSEEVPQTTGINPAQPVETSRRAQEQSRNLRLAKVLKEFQRILPKE